MTFLSVWVGYALFGVTLFSAFFVWGVREGQFSDLDKARYIALEGREIEDSNTESAPAKADLYLLRLIFAITFALLTTIFLIGSMQP